MFTALREVQIPVLAVMLLGGCAAKVWRALHARSAAAGAAGVPGVEGVEGVVPLHLRRPAVVMLFVAEAFLGLGLIGTAGRLGGAVPHLPATIVRTATALFFLVALGALNELRQRR